MKNRIKIVSYKNIYGELCYNYFQEGNYIGYCGNDGIIWRWDSVIKNYFKLA